MFINQQPAMTRRQMLLASGTGFGALALSAMLDNKFLLGYPGEESSTHQQKPHHAPRAKSGGRS